MNAPLKKSSSKRIITMYSQTLNVALDLWEYDIILGLYVISLSVANRTMLITIDIKPFFGSQFLLRFLQITVFLCT